MSELEIFLNSAKILQAVNSSTFFSIYKNFYKKSLEMIFRKSSVSITFRIRLNEQHNIINSDEKKKHLQFELANFLHEDKNYIKSSTNKILDIKSLKSFLKQQTKEFTSRTKEKLINSELFSVDVLFIKRAASNRDRYSGHIAFPGGKYEHADSNDYETAIRETQEEIGITLNSDSPIISRYIGANHNFEITIDFRYVVISHFFIMFDLFNESEKNFVISDKEISDVLYVPLSYLINIDIDNRKTFVKITSLKLFGEEVNIGKLILNNDDKFLLFGLTLRKLLNFFNSYKENIKHEDFFEFVHDGATNFLKKFVFVIYFSIFRFLTNPIKSYRLIKNIIIAVLFYYGIIYLSSMNFQGWRSKF